MDIIKKLAQELAIKEEQAKAAVQLIDEGNTIPFIARYRKEMTGALNDETLRNLHERLLYLRNLEEKKEQGGIDISDVPNYFAVTRYLNELQERKEGMTRLNVQMERFKNDF